MLFSVVQFPLIVEKIDKATLNSNGSILKSFPLFFQLAAMVVAHALLSPRGGGI